MKTDNMGRPTKNKHGVPASSWRKWSNNGRRIFNEVYEAMRPKMQFAFMHPKVLPLQRRFWETTRYNAAYTAAHAASRLPAVTKYIDVHVDSRAERNARKKAARK